MIENKFQFHSGAVKGPTFRHATTVVALNGDYLES
jgi:hypothetical protein